MVVASACTAYGHYPGCCHPTARLYHHAADSVLSGEIMLLILVLTMLVQVCNGYADTARILARDAGCPPSMVEDAGLEIRKGRHWCRVYRVLAYLVRRNSGVGDGWQDRCCHGTAQSAMSGASGAETYGTYDMHGAVCGLMVM